MQLKPGTTLQNGKYRIIKSLGQGGFGITYLAEQVALGRKVAVKEFFMKDCCERDEATSAVTVGTGSQREQVEKFRVKFLREAQMISQLDHPNIVRIIDVFAENDTAYYTMDYIVGGSLKELVAERGPLDEPTALKYIREVGDALQYVHRKKILHFDIKPSNIMLRESGTAALIDFGVSKHYDEGGRVTSATPVGISKGYAPMEQYRQEDISTFTPATDIYALGATLYTLLTGIVPPDASDVNEDGLPELPRQISKSSREAIRKAMSPRRKDRPQSVAEFLSLLATAPSPSSTVSAASAPVSEETVFEGKVFQKSESKPSLKSAAAPVPKKKSKTWLWALLGGLAVAAIILAIVLGGRKDKPVPADPMSPTDSLAFEAPLSDTTILDSVKLSSTPSGATIVNPGTAEAPLFPTSTTSTVKPTKGSINGHEWVDLGLSVKWATRNVGASSPSDYGKYYAWGETESKSKYSWSNLKYCTDSSGDHFSKYVPSGKAEYWSGGGSPDNKKKLEMSDDAARQNWGGSWRMPTDAEWTELREKCSWTWTKQGGKNGYKVTNKTNGNSIFLPAAGYRYEGGLNYEGYNGGYWSSSLTSVNSKHAWYVYFHSDEVGRSSSYRFYGFSVRPVSE